MTQTKPPAPLVLVALSFCFVTFLGGVGFGMQPLTKTEVTVTPATNIKSNDSSQLIEAQTLSESTDKPSRFTEEYTKFFMKEAKKNPRLTATDIDDKWLAHLHSVSLKNKKRHGSAL